MLDMLGRGYIRASIWLKCKVEEIKETEIGVSGIVAAIVLVAITLILVGIFWDKISGIVKTWFGQIESNSKIDATKAGGK
jgi:archaeal flagellin N-terminal-like domain